MSIRSVVFQEKERIDQILTEYQRKKSVSMVRPTVGDS